METTQFQDKTLVCKDCQNEFVWTAGEQSFYAERQFTPPQRCKACRQAKKARIAERGLNHEPRNYERR